MHNVKRTPASEAMNAAFASKRKAKLQHFVETTNKIFEKRNREEEFDEILHLTAEILEINPDIYTFWNIRRSALLSINKLLDESEEEFNKRQGNLFEKELELSYKCLMFNPKSYSTWFHRYWVLKRQSLPDLQKELDLCNKALELDCRNFHCFDHRRLVVKLAEVSDQDELKFSNDLIHVNPSNYSAWHYRGMLLIKTQPGHLEYGLPISENCLKSEFEKIIPLCSYNTEDQTLWTYCRWLTESACPKKEGQSISPIAKEILEKLVNWTYAALLRAIFLLYGVNEKTIARGKSIVKKIVELDPQRENLYYEIWSCFM